MNTPLLNEQLNAKTPWPQELGFYLKKWHDLWFRLKKTKDVKHMFDLLVQLVQRDDGLRYLQAMTLIARTLDSCTSIRLAISFMETLIAISPNELCSFMLDNQLQRFDKITRSFKRHQIEAAMIGQVQFFKRLADWTGDFNPSITSDGSTALHWAVKNDKKEMVQFIVNRHDSAHLQADEYGRTPLSVACESSSHADVFMILAKKMNVDPLEFAAEHGIYKIFKTIAMKNRVYNLKSYKWTCKGTTALHQAVIYRDQLFVSYILHHSDIDPLDGGDQGKSPFQLAALLKNYKAFTSIAFHADSNKLESVKFIKGRTALHYAVLIRDIRLVNYLLKKTNMNPNEDDDYGKSPLLMATFDARMYDKLLNCRVVY